MDPQHTQALVAQKQNDCRTPHYRFFDMTRGLPGSKLSKKAGNYIGKLRGNFARDEYTVFSSEKAMLGAVVYDKTDMVRPREPAHASTRLPRLASEAHHPPHPTPS